MWFIIFCILSTLILAEQIWCDDMDSITNWQISGISTKSNSSIYCNISGCVHIDHNSSIQMNNLIVSNHYNIQLRYSILSLDICTVYYCVDEINWIVLNEHNYTETWRMYIDDIYSHSNAPHNSTNISIKFESGGSYSNKGCYIDEVCLYGTIKHTINDVHVQETMTTKTDLADKDGKHTKHAILSDEYLLNHWYYLCVIAIAFMCLILCIFAVCFIKTNKNYNKIEDSPNAVVMHVPFTKRCVKLDTIMEDHDE
eukprot:115660_1